MTGEGPPPGSGPAPVDADPLAAFLKLAQREGSLEGEDLEAFLTGLRERADRIIAERLGRMETNLQVLETESHGQKDTIAALEGERAWLRETVDSLRAEAIQLADERRKASAGHESLLTHHRELMARLAGQLGEIAALSPLRAREIRRRLRALADLLRADTL
jgi:septal ring factor EnvC (AmiA/AmiB activator)